MGMPSVPQLLIILVIVVLIFGAKRLKNLGGDLGSAVKGFKEAVKDEDGKDKATAELEDATNQASKEAFDLADKAEDTVINKADDQKST